MESDLHLERFLRRKHGARLLLTTRNGGSKQVFSDERNISRTKSAGERSEGEQSSRSLVQDQGSPS